MILLAVLFLGGINICYPGNAAKQSMSEVVIRATRSALQAYKEKFGSYPEVTHPERSVTIGNRVYKVGGAACLYQALTGDGFDQIKGRKDKSAPASDGKIDQDEELNITLNDMPKEMWARSGDIYYLVDGYGHPVQYVKSAAVIIPPLGQPASDPITVNQGTYDIWSNGADNENIQANSLEATGTATGNGVGAKWIKNW
ncbi:MAG: hypothetical protein V4662_07140 [Verrucomicrobiota bacterium]